EDFRSLLLCHTAGQMTMPDHVIQARLTAIESMSMDDYAQMVVNQAVGPKAGEFAREWISEILARNDPEIYGTVLKNVLCGFDMADQLSKIRVPTLVLVGESDQVIPVESGLRLAEEIPNTELAVISDAGHVSYVEQPAAFQKSILSFLT
ncbi:MAG: alpha/beta fold hydrolase, partial [Pseudomonadales bacterium]